jgi:hypothetical protein
MKIKLTSLASIPKNSYVEMVGYVSRYQLQPKPGANVRLPDLSCDHEWAVEVVDIRPAVAPTPLPATATRLAIEEALFSKGPITNLGFTNLSIHGTTGYLFSYDQIRSFDTSDPEHLRLLSVIPIPETVDWLFTEEHRAILIYGRSAQIMDLPDPSHAKLRGRYLADQKIERVALQGDMLYLLLSESLQIVDLRDPDHPVARGNYPFTGHAGNIIVEGDRAYTHINNSVLIFDVHNPDKPTRVGQQYLRGMSRMLSVQDQMVYVRVGEDMAVLDMHDVASTKVVRKEPGLGADVMLAQGDLRFQIVDDALRVLEQHGTDAFVLKSSYRASDMPYKNVQKAGDLLYLIGINGLDIVDIRDPAQPTLRALYRY